VHTRCENTDRQMPFGMRFSDLAHSTQLSIVGKWHPIIWAGWILCRFISHQLYSYVAQDHEGGPSFLVPGLCGT